MQQQDATTAAATTTTMISTAFLQAEIAAAEKRIQQNEEEQRVNLQTTADTDAETAAVSSPQLRLAQLEQETNDLLLMQKLTEWAASQTVLYDNHNDDDDDSPTVATSRLLLDKVEAVQELGEILCQHRQKQETSATTTTPSLSQQVYQQEFVPQHRYLRAKLLQLLRQELQQTTYPAECEGLLQEWEQQQQQQQHEDHDSATNDCAAFTKIAQACQGLALLARVQKQVTTTVLDPLSSSSSSQQYQQDNDHNGVDDNNDDDVLTELCRPIVERVRFHFLEPSPDRPTSTRIDRLPEWLCSYMRDHVLETGVWEVVTHDAMKTALGKDDINLPTNFLNEMIRLMQFVLEERGYFRHPTIAGSQSKPLLLNNAIQQLLEFDAYVQTLILSSNEDSGETNMQQQHKKKDRIIRLFDACIAGDEELLAWWLERERESIFATLFEEPVPDSLPQLLSPRAELFCALIRSVRTKAAVFTFSGPYLAQVAAPLCGQFLEAVQESSNDLRRLLLSTPSSRSSRRPTDDNFRKNCLSWMELINGTHLAATMLSRPPDTATSLQPQNDSGHDIMGEQDIIRFGQSLSQLETVLIEDFGRTFVETLLMERAKLAAYLMRCSYLVGSSGNDEQEDDPMQQDSVISLELRDTKRLLSIFLNVCNHADDNVDDGDDDLSVSSSLVEVGFAARAMRDCVLNLVTDKLLHVALNTDGMTPDLLLPGCMVFARDVNALFAGSLLPPLALRLLDICKIMSMDRDELVNIGNAMCGLAGYPAPLPEDAFSEDDRLADEALSMMQAKGFAWMQLSDAITVLNRRRDLS